MTPEKLKEYLNGNTKLCPYCGKKNVSIVTIDITPDTMKQHYFCVKCDKLWFGVFNITITKAGEL